MCSGKRLEFGKCEGCRNLELCERKGYTIVTFDSDFRDLSLMRGIPPKIIWIRTGNLTTANIEMLIRNKIESIEDFLTNSEYEDIGCLELDS